MPKDLNKESVNTGNVVYEWTLKEFAEYERSRRWYISMFVIGALLIIYSLVTADYLFALVIVLFGIVLYLHEMQPPLDVYFAITEAGIIIGKKFYRFNELDKFWIVYNPPEVKNLYFGMKHLLKHRLKVPLLDFDPEPVRNYLAAYLEEDVEQEEEPLSDRLARIFKIH